MKKFIRALLAVVICFSFAVFAPTDTRAASNFIIQSHDVEMVVYEDGKIDVIETMAVEFTTNSHGIYAYIPTKYYMDFENVNGKNYHNTYTFPVTGLEVLSNHQYSTDSGSEYACLKIGSADYFANKNETYKFKYTIQTRDLEMDGLQMLFMNIATDGWSTYTEKLTYKITMPKEFDVSKLQFDGPMGLTTGTGSFNGFHVYVEGNTIYGSYDRVLRSTDAITVRLWLNDDYFAFPTMKQTALNDLYMSLCMALMMFSLYVIFGTDKPLKPTAEYRIPGNMNSAEMGKIIDGEADEDDILSLILDWGRRGIVSIEEDNDKLILIKETELPEDAKNYEVTFFNAIFKKQDRVKLTGSYYNTLITCTGQLDAEFTGKKRLFTISSKLMRILNTINLFLLYLMMPSDIEGFKTGDASFSIFLGIIGYILLVITCILINSAYKKRFINDKDLKDKLIVSAVFFTIAVGMECAVMMICGASILVCIPFVALIAAMIYMIARSLRRTKYYNSVLEPALGLRDYIMNVQQGDIEQMLEENPYLFYDLLPYAYALGLMDDWAERFEGLKIQTPKWYHSKEPLYGNDYDYGYRRCRRLCHCMDRTRHHATYVPPSSSSSSGSSGSSHSSGGFSSHSSGGFSGGGFGGSRGGSW